MHLATWNVNGIRARSERVLAWLAAVQPDVVCLQEIKIPTGQFPVEPFRACGYDVAVHGQRAYNGVAIVARTPITDVRRGFEDGEDDEQARFVAATVDGVRVMSVYVPNGQALGSEKFAYKLRWLERLRAHVDAHVDAGAPAVLAGDLNVAPTDLDVHDPAAWGGHVLCSVEERAALTDVVGDRLVDVVRRVHPTTQLFSWWDYRQLAFPRNHGLRIDHILATPPLADRVADAGVDREARKGKQPSDHAPVWARFR